LTVTGDVTVTGIVTAQEFHTEFVSASIIFSSGSTLFGDSSDDTHTFIGDLILTSGSLSYQENTDVDTGTETVATIATADYDAAFFDFLIKSGSHLRAGTVYSVHDGTNVEYVETSTQDLGSTSDVTLAVDISGGDLRLRATTTSNNWIIRSLVRGL